jgi:hypothetical protein
MVWPTAQPHWLMPEFWKDQRDGGSSSLDFCHCYGVLWLPWLPCQSRTGQRLESSQWISPVFWAGTWCAGAMQSRVWDQAGLLCVCCRALSCRPGDPLPKSEWCWFIPVSCKLKEPGHRWMWKAMNLHVSLKTRDLETPLRVPQSLPMLSRVQPGVVQKSMTNTPTAGQHGRWSPF